MPHWQLCVLQAISPGVFLGFLRSEQVLVECVKAKPV
jgi:hypothetical protein